jgi:periplasmic divalent cation tolerance protein
VCTAKTREDLYAPLEQAIRELHPYETPAIVATPVVAGSQSYLEWIAAETSALIS